MIEKFNKIIDKIAKFENYYILRREKKAVIIACRPLIDQIIKFSKNPFCRGFEKKTERKFPLFFLITSFGKGFNNALNKEFEKKELPILYLETHHAESSIEELQKYLGDFVLKTFLS